MLEETAAVQAQEQLLAWMQASPGVVVAFSGGVDSSVVAYAARLAVGSRALAVIADSPSLARSEFQAAVELAAAIGIQLRVLKTQEGNDAAYRANDSQRCFHCKSHLFLAMRELPEVDRLGWWMVTGTNADDLGDWRPGLQAARDNSVRSPLAELGLAKSTVRELAASWNLPVADKPASPCLASRLAYGLEVTPERLRMIEAAEAVLRGLGLRQLRVRLHPNDLARIEVPVGELQRLVQLEARSRLVESLSALGFRYVTLDLAGFKSGNLNQLISLDVARRTDNE